MSLFYTYPLWNYLGAKFIFGEPVQGKSLPYIGLGLLGTFLVSSQGIADEVGGLVKAPLSAGMGIVAALAAALTESAMYFVVKERDSATPWASLLELYGGATGWLLLAVPLLGLKIRASASDVLKMLVFNIVVGFVGYALRFFAVPRVKTEIFVGERPSLWTLVGAVLLVFAMSQIETLK
jgi:drug/metabolite transporter (DMT)-like permease